MNFFYLFILEFYNLLMITLKFNLAKMIGFDLNQLQQ